MVYKKYSVWGGYKIKGFNKTLSGFTGHTQITSFVEIRDAIRLRIFELQYSAPYQRYDICWSVYVSYKQWNLSPNNAGKCI